MSTRGAYNYLQNLLSGFYEVGSSDTDSQPSGDYIQIGFRDKNIQKFGIATNQHTAMFVVMVALYNPNDDGELMAIVDRIDELTINKSDETYRVVTPQSAHRQPKVGDAGEVQFIVTIQWEQ